MKIVKLLVLSVSVAFAFAASCIGDAGITTNLVVYTDIYCPKGSSHYYGTKLELAFRDGQLTGCNRLGSFDLFNGLPSKKSNREQRADKLGVYEDVNETSLRIAKRVSEVPSAEKQWTTVAATNDVGTASIKTRNGGGGFCIQHGGSWFAFWCGKAKRPCKKHCIEMEWTVESARLFGFSDNARLFPEGIAEFETWNWEKDRTNGIVTRRYHNMKLGECVALMGKDGRICAVRVVKVLDRSRGADRDELQIEYRIY